MWLRVAGARTVTQVSFAHKAIPRSQSATRRWSRKTMRFGVEQSSLWILTVLTLLHVTQNSLLQTIIGEAEIVVFLLVSQTCVKTSANRRAKYCLRVSLFEASHMGLG